MSAFQGKGKYTKTVLYVINHTPSGDTVESFSVDVKKKTLTHLKTIKDPTITSGFDLAVIAMDKFFLTNDFYFRRVSYWRAVEYMLRLNLGNLIFYNGEYGKVVEKRLENPAGVAITSDKNHLFVSLMSAEVLRMYNLTREFDLKVNVEAPLNTVGQSIFIDPDNGELWMATQTVFFHLATHLMNPHEAAAPSHILHVTIDKDSSNTWSVAEPYSDDGTQLTASSSVVYYKGQLLVGSLHHRMVHCQDFRLDLYAMSGDGDVSWSIKNGDIDAVKRLLTRQNVNEALATGGSRPPLHLAADYGQVDVIRYLVQIGADVNLADQHGITPLLAAVWEGHLSAVQALLGAGAKAEHCRAPDGSPLVQCTEKEEIKRLLCGATVNSV